MWEPPWKPGISTTRLNNPDRIERGEDHGDCDGAPVSSRENVLGCCR